MKRRYLVSLMEKAQFNKEFFDTTLNTFDQLVQKNALDNLLDIVSAYEKGEIEFFDAGKKVELIAEQTNLHPFCVYTVYFAFMAEVLRKRYIEKGYPLDMWLNFVKDFQYQATDSNTVHGVWGQYCAPLWQSRYFNYTIFGFGTLQFEIRKFGGYYKEGNLEIKEDTPVLFAHVPNTGKPLKYENVLESYKKAEKFFTDNYLSELNGKVIFVLRSWVMSKKFASILKPTSNMLVMANDYDVFKYGEYADKDADTIWRIFGKELKEGEKLSDLPENTSLQRGVKDLLLRGEQIGWGWGVYKPHVEKYK
ncbi:MAG: hypothetical protein IKZ38_02355 [Clostridia bacterium]|nr:hypothetical protein [Clostridia bacterium]